MIRTFVKCQKCCREVWVKKTDFFFSSFTKIYISSFKKCHEKIYFSTFLTNKCFFFLSFLRKQEIKKKLKMPPKYFRYNLVVAGSGSAAFNDESVADIVIRQVLKLRQLRNNNNRVVVDDALTSSKPIVVSYVGVCTYDSPISRERQVGKLEAKGCKILDINVTWPKLTRPFDELRNDLLSSDVILFSGGNTLYAMRRFLQLGLDKVFLEAAEKGIILSGGSAGSIIPFDAGHSDSADPSTFRPRAPPTSSNNDDDNNVEAQSENAPPPSAEDFKNWKYLRVSALGLLPGLVCPHHDRTQSNGVPRYIDFDAMLKRHRYERGICLDHWCVLVVEQGGTYELFEVPQMTGSVVVPGGKEYYNSLREQQEGKNNSSSSSFISGATFDPKSANAIPGMWIKDVIMVEPTSADADPSESLQIKARCCAPRGKLEDILRECPTDKMTDEKNEEDEVMRKNSI